MMGDGCGLWVVVVVVGVWGAGSDQATDRPFGPLQPIKSTPDTHSLKIRGAGGNQKIHRPHRYRPYAIP